MKFKASDNVHYVYMTPLLFDVIGRIYPKDREEPKTNYCQHILLNQMPKRQKYRDMRKRHPSVIAVRKFKTDVRKKKRCERECNKTIISITFVFFH